VQAVPRMALRFASARVNKISVNGRRVPSSDRSTPNAPGSGPGRTRWHFHYTHLSLSRRAGFPAGARKDPVCASTTLLCYQQHLAWDQGSIRRFSFSGRAFHLPTLGWRVETRDCFFISRVESRLSTLQMKKRVGGSRAWVGSSPRNCVIRAKRPVASV